MEIVKVITKEYREGDNAVKTTSITLFGMPIFRYKKLTTNNKAVALLTVQKKTIIKGFKNED
nr:MAG TPA: hypothetical protein [Crassvirales sp.]